MTLNLPSVGGDENQWGEKLNAALTDLDVRVDAAAAAAEDAAEAVEDRMTQAETDARVTALSSNTFVILSPSAARVHPVSGAALPTGASVLWVCSSEPVNIDATRDVWLNV